MERKWWSLLAVCLATFMLLLDITVVNVALPDIQKELDTDLTGLQWVVDAYTLTLAALTLTMGTLADRYGRRRLFVIGVGVFTLASLLCGLATNATFLHLARGLQGVGGAAIFDRAANLAGTPGHSSNRSGQPASGVGHPGPGKAENREHSCLQVSERPGKTAHIGLGIASPDLIHREYDLGQLISETNVCNLINHQ